VIATVRAHASPTVMISEISLARGPGRAERDGCRGAGGGGTGGAAVGATVPDGVVGSGCGSGLLAGRGSGMLSGGNSLTCQA
jgi:hypothetical protein